MEYELINLPLLHCFPPSITAFNAFCAPTAFQELGVQELRVAAEEFILVIAVVFPKASHDWLHKLDEKLTSALGHI